MKIKHKKDAYTQAVQHAKDLINKTTDPTLAKSIIDQATQAVTDAKTIYMVIKN